jgi:Uncharacterized protein involved in outer membrane biogenesis
MHQTVRKVLTNKWIVVTTGAVALYALTGFFAVPSLLRWYLPHFVEQTWHCRAEVETIRLNPFLLTVEIKGFSLQQADGSPLLAFDRFLADLETESLWRWAVVLRELTLEKPVVHLDIEPDGTVNFMRLFPAGDSETDSPPSSPLPFLLHNLDIREAALNLTDKRASVPAVLAVQGMNLALRHCSTLPDQTGTYSFAATLPEHGAVQVDGTFSLLPLQSRGKLTFTTIDMANLWQFAKDSLPVDQLGGTLDFAAAYDLEEMPPGPRIAVHDVHLAISDLSLALRDAATVAGAPDGQKNRFRSARVAMAGIDCQLRAQFEMGGDTPAATLKEVAVQLKGIKVSGAGAEEPLFAADTLSMEGGDLELQKHTVTVDRIALHTGHVDVVREADGILDWQRFILGQAADASAQKQDTAVQAGPEWGMLVKSFDVGQFRFRFADLTTSSDKPLVSIQGINAQLTGIDGKSPIGFKIGFQVEQGGSAMFNGVVHPLIPAVETDIDLRDMALMPLQPYLEPFARVQVQSAFISARGRLEYGLPEASRLGNYEGSFSLDKLKLADPAESKPYLGWEALQLPKFKLTLQPNMLETQEIIVVQPMGSIFIDKDKKLNLAKMVSEQPPAQSDRTPQSAAQDAGPRTNGEDAFTYRIDKVRIENGDIAFADFSLQPRFRTRIRELKGTILQLASTKDMQAKVQMTGRVDEFGTAKISGVLRPNDFAKASDIHLVFHNLDMKNLSSYSGKFAGRTIKSGKISADLSYTMQDRKMTGENKIVIDNLVLGDKVETNEEGGNLPLDLAIALLKDAKGRIDIGLPVTGEMDDPQFSIAALAWKAMSNVITKAVTAPFLALGSLFGDGEAEQLGIIPFNPGSYDLEPQEKARLLKLADALDNRPQLKLIVQGRYSVKDDGLVLKGRDIRRAVAASLGAKPGPGDTPETIDLSDSGIRNALEKLYVKRFGKEGLAALEKDVETGTVVPKIPTWHTDKPDREPGMAAKMVGSLHLYKLVPGGRSPEQKELWAGELYARLVEHGQASGEAMSRLADRRAQAIIVHLESQQRISRERVGVKEPEPLADDEPPAATLSLDTF